MTITQLKARATKLSDLLNELLLEVEDLQSDAQNEADSVDRDDLTPQQEERQERLQELADQLQEVMDLLNDATDIIYSI